MSMIHFQFHFPLGGSSTLQTKHFSPSLIEQIRVNWPKNSWWFVLFFFPLCSVFVFPKHWLFENVPNHGHKTSQCKHILLSVSSLKSLKKTSFELLVGSVSLFTTQDFYLIVTNTLPSWEESFPFIRSETLQSSQLSVRARAGPPKAVPVIPQGSGAGRLTTFKKASSLFYFGD